MSITVLTPTHRKSNIITILDNFIRQKYEEKELIVLLNHQNPDLYKWKELEKLYNNISAYHLGRNRSLGSSLNFGVTKAKYDYIAKFDDDDYYGPNYLINSLESLNNSNSDIVGKTSYYIYFKNENLIGLKNSSRENKFTKRVAGSTFLIKKEILQDIKFKDKNLGEDIDFCIDAIKNGFRIFSNDRNDYIYIRSNKNFHTWKIESHYLINECTNLVELSNIEDFYKMW